MKRTNFENLKVYQLSEELSDHLWNVVTRWNSLAQTTIGRQLVRSADSIGANIAEGTGRGSYQDNRRFILVARGSLYETKHWLRRAYRRKLLSTAEVQQLRAITNNLPPLLNGYLRSISIKTRL